MKISDTTKGYLWTFLAILAVSNVYIFSKAVLNKVDFEQFGFWWFLTGGVYILILMTYKGAFKIYRTFGKKEFAILLVNGLLELGGTYFFYKAIEAVPNPSIVSFLNNLSPVFTVILGTVFLHERFNFREAVGIMITLLGAFLISYKGGHQLSEMFIHGSHYVLYSTFLFAINSILLKTWVKRLSPYVLTINRILFLTTFFTLLMILHHKPFHISWDVYKNVLIGAFLGPLLTVVASLHALKYIEVSKKSVLGTLKGLFVLFGSYLFFHNFPTRIQIIGGILSITGAILIITGRMQLRNKKK